jgi:hypothetical protein
LSLNYIVNSDFPEVRVAENSATGFVTLLYTFYILFIYFLYTFYIIFIYPVFVTVLRPAAFFTVKLTV